MDDDANVLSGGDEFVSKKRIDLWKIQPQGAMMSVSRTVSRFLGANVTERRLGLLEAMGMAVSTLRWKKSFEASKAVDTVISISRVDAQSRPMQLYFRSLPARIIQGSGSDLHFYQEDGDHWWEDEWRKVSTSEVRDAMARRRIPV